MSSTKLTPLVSRRAIVRVEVHNESQRELVTKLEVDEQTGIAHVYVRVKEGLIIEGG